MMDLSPTRLSRHQSLPANMSNHTLRSSNSKTSEARRKQTLASAQMQPKKCVGNWQLTLLAGRGSFTDVYLAKPVGCRPNWPADYAVKVLKSKYADDQIAIDMLRRESQVAAEVSHPHLVAVLETHLEEAPYFLVMPRLKGVSVARIVEKAGHLSLRQSLWVCRQVAEALDALHRRNWLHGDVKPENIMFSSEGHVTLVDLGFAGHRSEAMLTEARAVAGTMNYIPPEVLTSAFRADQHSDIYSLGISLFEMLTGRLPFRGTDPAALVEAHRNQPLPDPRDLRPHLTGDVVSLLSRMTAKDPARRPQSSKELISELIPLEVSTMKAERQVG